MNLPTRRPPAAGFASALSFQKTVSSHIRRAQSDAANGDWYLAREELDAASAAISTVLNEEIGAV